MNLFSGYRWVTSANKYLPRDGAQITKYDSRKQRKVERASNCDWGQALHKRPQWLKDPLKQEKETMIKVYEGEWYRGSQLLQGNEYTM